MLFLFIIVTDAREVFREIKQFQKNTKLLLSKRLFDRVVKEVFVNCRKFKLQIQSKTMKILQKITKTMFIARFENID